MNKIALVTFFVFFAMIICTSCDNEEPKEEEFFSGIEEISFENFPKTDGSTSTRALRQMIGCKLLGVRYEWVQNVVSEWYLRANEEDIPEQYADLLDENIWTTSQTNGAFMNLINKEADIILTHRTISPDEKAYAETKGVTLIETSIALDAFVFVVHKNNPVKSLTVNQIQKIYTGEITNWAEVGGNNAAMKAFTRPRNSGSEEVFREVVMAGLEPADLPEREIGGMAGVFIEINENENSICYTFNNYKEVIVRAPNNEIPTIAINGISPNESTVKNRTFPFISEVYVAIRSDLNHNSMAYKLYEWLQTDDVKSTIIECGFIPR